MKMDWPPVADKNKDQQEDFTKETESKISLFEKHGYIDQNDFRQMFNAVICDAKLFKEYSSRLATLVNFSIDEMFIVENLNNYDDESEIKIEKALNEKVDSYLGEVFNKYEKSSFSQKIKLISFLSDLFSRCFFNNNYFSREKISNFFKEILNTEKENKGNHYIYTYLKGILDNKKDISVDRISPSQFLKEKWVENNNDHTNNDDIFPAGKNQLFISDPSDFKILSKLNKELNNNFTNEKFEEYSSFFQIPFESSNVVLGNNINIDNNYLDIYFFQNKSIRDLFEQKTGLKLEDFGIPEQYNYFEYTKDAANEEAEIFYSFVKKYNKDGFRTFLSVEQGGKEMGNKILELGEKLPEDVAQKVFTKYGEIIDSVSKITEFARTNFTKEIETNPELIKKIEETLYIKGKQLLSQTYDDLGSRKEINYADIENQLDRINADTITTFAIFKQALKNGEKPPIESIEGAVFSKKDAGEISKDQENEMIEMYEINWKNHPDRNFVESLKSYFKTAFSPEKNKEKNYLYTFEKDKKIRAFVRFEKQDDESFYASALNVDEASKNFGLGEAMMDEALTREAQEHILHASCRKDNPSNMRYFEKGFISRGFKKTSETEEFDLVWDENKNKKIKAKQKSQEELIGLYDNSNTDDFEIKKSKDLESLHLTIPENKSLVRCFVKNGEWYAVYEKVAENYGVNFEDTK